MWLIAATQKMIATAYRKFLDISLAASAHYLITGDPDLLVLHPYRRHTQIITPADFLALI